MSVKCGIEEGSDEIATFQYREHTKRIYKPGVYLARQDCSCCYPSAKLNHLVISKNELRFSYAKELDYIDWFHCLWDTFCCLCCKNVLTENERLFGPVKSSSVFSYDVKRVELETYDVLKKKSVEGGCTIYNWFTMLLWALWQIYIVIHLQTSFYIGVLKKNTMNMALVVLQHIVPSFIILICPLLIDACNQTRKRCKRLKVMREMMKEAEHQMKAEQVQPQAMVQVQVPANAVRGTKLSVPAQDGSMVTVEVPQGAQPNTVLQIPVLTQNIQTSQVKDNFVWSAQDREKEFSRQKRKIYCYSCGTFCVFIIVILHCAVLAMSLEWLNPMGATLRFRGENEETRRRLYSHEIPPAEMFVGIDLYDMNKTAVLDVYKTHWDNQRKLIQKGQIRLLGENNDTETTKVCKNAKFDANGHYHDTINCKCMAEDHSYWTCHEETEEGEEEDKPDKDKDEYICPKVSVFKGAACDECAWCRNSPRLHTSILLIGEMIGFALLTSMILLLDKKSCGLTSRFCCCCCCCKNKQMVGKNSYLYDVFHLGKITFIMKGNDRLKYSTVLLLEDAIAARKLFYKLESTREVLKRDIKSERAW